MLMADFVDDLKKDTSERLKDFMWLPIILFGGVLYGLGELSITKEYPFLVSSFNAVGSTVITATVFVTIVKSKQFTDIFKKQLRKIVYCEEHLSLRKDLEAIWERASLALCEEKFDSISKELHANIKKFYLPIAHDYYYKGYELESEIDYDSTNDDYIVLSEENKTTIVSADAKQPIVYTFGTTIPIPRNDEKMTSYELNEISINGTILVDHNKYLTISRNDKELRVDFKYTCFGKPEYEIIRKEKKRYSLDVNSFKGHLSVGIYKNFKIKINYPLELHLEWLDIGTVNEWTVTRKKGKHSKTLIGEYKGLIFNSQGFITFFKKHTSE